MGGRPRRHLGPAGRRLRQPRDADQLRVFATVVTARAAGVDWTYTTVVAAADTCYLSD